MASEQEILANLENSLGPGAMSLAEVFHTGDAKICAYHPSRLTIFRNRYLGVFRKERPLIRTYKRNGETVHDLFDKQAFSGERVYEEWQLPPSEDFRLIVPSRHLHLVNVMGEISDAEIDVIRWKRHGEWYKKNPGRTSFESASYDEIVPEWLYIDVFTCEETITRLLSRDPINSADAYDILRLPLPDAVFDEGRKLAIKKLISLYRDFQAIESREKFLERKTEELRKVAVGSGVYSEGGGVIGIAEDEDDIKVITMGDRLGLQESIRSLGTQIDYLKKIKVGRFVKELELYSGIKLNVEEFIKGLGEDFNFDKKSR